MAPKKDNNSYIKYSSLGIQMAVTIALGAFAGNWLDEKYQKETPVFTLILTLVAIAVALYQVIKEVLLLSKDDDSKSTDSKNQSQSENEK